LVNNGRRTAKPPVVAQADADAVQSEAGTPIDGSPIEPPAEPPVEAATELPAEMPVELPESWEPTGKGANPLTGIPVTEWIAAINHAALETFGEEWEPQLARFLAFLRRRVTGDYSIDPYGFDAEVTAGFFMAVLRPIAQKWFRIEVVGAENIPATGGALVVSNHSGTLPMDALMTLVQVHDHSGRFLRLLGADLVFRLPFVSSIARKAGATLACSEDAERMLRDGEVVGVWPEGFKGIGKPFSERYKLQRFGRGGFVASAIRTGVPIIPVSVVGAEEIYPLVGNIPGLARALGLPYLPITPFFPLFGPLGAIPLPSKWLIEFGEPIRTDSYEAGAADDPMLVFNVTDQVRETIQQTLFGLLQQRQSIFR
jgi:1-acyl-sn-glycerol-3-phosphate acyltransferase